MNEREKINNDRRSEQYEFICYEQFLYDITIEGYSC